MWYLCGEQADRRSVLADLHRHRQHRLHNKFEKLEPPDVAAKRCVAKALNAVGIQHAVLARW